MVDNIFINNNQFQFHKGTIKTIFKTSILII